MRYRVCGISEAAVNWVLNDGDVVTPDHPAFADNPVKLRMYLEAGYLVPLEQLETAMVAAPENAMRPRARARRGR